MHVHARRLPSSYRSQPRAATEKGRWSPRSSSANRPDPARRRRTRRARRDARRVGRLHRHQPAVLGQARLRRGRPVRPRAQPAAYVDTLRAVFREARRVLADDGTCWLNLGDSYSAGGAAATGLHAYLGRGLAGRHAPGMAAKNLLGLPWRVALALQDDGWILRNAIVWHKPNAMPESVRDRLNCRHELIFLLVKSRHYWFDLDPIRVPHATARHSAHAGRSSRAPAGDSPAAGGTAAGTAAGRYPAAQVRAAHPAGHRRPPLRHRPQQPRPPQRPQPRRRVVDPDPPLPRPAFRRVPDRAPAAVHRRRLQARRHGARPVLRHRHHRPCRPRARPPVHRHRPQPGVCRPCRRTAAACRRSRQPDGNDRTAADERHGATHAACRTRHGRARQTSLLPAGHKSPAHTLPNRAAQRTIAGPVQGRAAPTGRTVTATAEDPSA